MKSLPELQPATHWRPQSVPAKRPAAELPAAELPAVERPAASPPEKGPAPDALPDEPERRVTRQLVEALLFEGLAEFRVSPRTTSGPGARFEAIYDSIFDLRLGRCSYRCAGVVASFGRVRIAQGSIERQVSDGWREATLRDVVDSLEVDTEAKQRLETELTQTVALCRWNRAHLAHHARPRRQLPFQDLESAIHEGHPYHPSFKARAGFSLRDHREYGPEAGACFQLHWLACARGATQLALPVPQEEFWKRELGDHVYADLSARLAEQGASWCDYALLPVHPWQLRALEAPLARAFVDRTLLPLGPAGDLYHSTQSLRTLVNADRPGKANVKLPLDTVCTSSPRSFRKHFVCTAPAVSQWLTAVVLQDPFLDGRVLLLREYAAVLHAPAPVRSSSGGTPPSTIPDGMLGVIFRESVLSKLEPGEAAVPFTALTVVESDERPFIADWLAVHGVERWVSRILDVMLIPLWHLLCHHGIAFEAHAQNLILVHRQGWPEKIVLRDFHDDTEFVPDFLRRPDLLPDFGSIDPYFDTVPDDDGYRMSSTDDLRELFTDTVYVFNLADLAFLLERYFGFSERHFWTRARDVLAAYEASGVTEKSRITRLACDTAELAVESLLKKKLLGGGLLDFFSHHAPNPLVARNTPRRPNP